MTNTMKISTRRIAFNAVFMAIYVALRYLNIPVGNSFRFTLAPFSVILCALLYGPVDGLIVGFCGEFLSQILGPYGLTPTTVLWCVGETTRGLTLGLCAMLHGDGCTGSPGTDIGIVCGFEYVWLLPL